MINCLKYHEKAKTKHFYDNIFEKGDILIAIPITNRSTRIPELSVSLIILTTDIFNNSLKKKVSLNRMFLIIFQYFSQYN